MEAEQVFFSIVVPVYNRPDEVEELLESLCLQQANKPFEVVVVEDGSAIPCKAVVERYANRLNIQYFSKPNSGPGQSRNYGAERSKGVFLLILDSDCTVPPKYLASVQAELDSEPDIDAFGGPDRALDTFTDIQKAISYAMTSFFTTGGIRGGKKKLDKFYPRSFNMGIKRSVYNNLGGFSKMRFGEDIDFSIRLYKAGCKVRLFPSAYVFHKRRTDWRKFYRQVFNSGMARINLYKMYPSSLRLVHLLPALFVVFSALSVAGAFFCWYSIIPIALWCMLIFIDASLQYKRARIGFLAIIASVVQLFGYGLGFLWAAWNRLVLHKGPQSAFLKNFYK